MTPWAYAIARRLMIDGARRRRLERRLFADAPDGDDAAYEPAQSTAGAEELLHARRVQGRVREQLEDLPESQRTAYRLLQQEGLSLKAAGRSWRLVTAVKLTAHRAYVALRPSSRRRSR